MLFFRDAIYSCIVDVLNGKVSCRFDEPEEDEDEESEYDIAIMEAAGEILPKFGKAMSSQEFFTYFSRLFQFFVSKIVRSLSSKFKYFILSIFKPTAKLEEQR